MPDLLDHARSFLASIDYRTLGACCLALDFVLLGALAMFWEAAGRATLFAPRKSDAGEKRKR